MKDNIVKKLIECENDINKRKTNLAKSYNYLRDGLAAKFLFFIGLLNLGLFFSFVIYFFVTTLGADLNWNFYFQIYSAIAVSSNSAFIPLFLKYKALKKHNNVFNAIESSTGFSMFILPLLFVLTSLVFYIVSFGGLDFYSVYFVFLC